MPSKLSIILEQMRGHMNIICLVEPHFYGIAQVKYCDSCSERAYVYRINRIENVVSLFTFNVEYDGSTHFNQLAFERN